MSVAVPTVISAASARLPQTYENAKTALANCAQLDECQDWADKAAYREETARLVAMALGREAHRAGGVDQRLGGVDR